MPSGTYSYPGVPPQTHALTHARSMSAPCPPTHAHPCHEMEGGGGGGEGERSSTSVMEQEVLELQQHTPPPPPPLPATCGQD